MRMQSVLSKTPTDLHLLYVFDLLLLNTACSNVSFNLPLNMAGINAQLKHVYSPLCACCKSRTRCVFGIFLVFEQ